MTAIAPAPTHAPVVAGPAQESRQGAGDRFAFAAVLDSLPRAEATASPAVAEKPAGASDKHRETTQTQPDFRAALVDSALMSSLRFAAPSESAPGALRRGSAGASGLAAVPKKAPESEDGAAPHAVNPERANGAAPARLVGERTFLPSAAYSGGAIAGPLKHGASATAPGRVAKPADLASEPGEPAAAGLRSGAGPPDPGASGAGASTPGSPLDSRQSPSIVWEGPLRLGLAGSTSGGAAAPRSSAIPASPAPVASPVKEIDVDLSPGGLEKVSMTMRLAGDRLSLVIRASSSQTLGAIEGARDAIADRLAAIGQPLGSLIIQQTDATADATSNANAASGDERPTAGERQSGQRAAAGRGDSNDSGAPRRGSPGDLGL